MDKQGKPSWCLWHPRPAWEEKVRKGVYVLTGLRGGTEAWVKASAFKLVPISVVGQGHTHTSQESHSSPGLLALPRGQVVKVGDAILPSGAFPQGWKA